MKIAWSISAIPPRLPLVQELLVALPTARVQLDDPPSGSSWGNYRRALSMASKGVDWIVSIDDDAILCDDFAGTVERALEKCPGDFSTFYMHNELPVMIAQETGACWIATQRVVHGIGWAIRAEHAYPALRTIEKICRPEYYSGDQRLMAWLIYSGKHNYCAVPNLVDHRGAFESYMAPRKGRTAEGRTAACFDQAANIVEWSNTTIRDPRSCNRRMMRKLYERGLLYEPLLPPRYRSRGRKVPMPTEDKPHLVWPRGR